MLRKFIKHIFLISDSNVYNSYDKQILNLFNFLCIRYTYISLNILNFLQQILHCTMSFDVFNMKFSDTNV